MNMAHSPRLFFHRRGLFLAVVLVLSFLAGCRQNAGSSDVAPTPTSVTPPTAESNPPAVVPTPTPGLNEIIIWAPPPFTPESSEEEAAQLLLRQISAFEAANPSIRVRYEPKAPTGKSGLLQFLRSASTVAPRVLPDLVILPSADFTDAARAGVLYPLDSLLPEAVLDPLYPFAWRDGRVGESLLGVPLLVTVEHLVYRPQATFQPPTTWEQVLAGEQPFLFAAGGRSDGVGNAFLLQVLNVTGKPVPSGELPDIAALERVLAFYESGRARGVIPFETISLTGSQDVWGPFLSGRVNMIETDARTFLTEREEVTGLAYAPVPTSDGRPTTVAEGYVVAVTTPDPVRQQAAARYLAWLLSPEQLGPYAAVTNWLPARADTLEIAIADAGYRQFVGSLLEQAWLRPSGAQWIAISKTLQEAVQAVLSGERTASETIERLQQNLRP